MSIVVKLSPGEQFINWFPHHTKLYLRGERGKSPAEVDAMYRELAREFNAWFRRRFEGEG